MTGFSPVDLRVRHCRQKGNTVNKGLLAAAALSMMASVPMAKAETYAIPNGWAPNTRSGNNKARRNGEKVKAKRRIAAKSRQQQRKSGR